MFSRGDPELDQALQAEIEQRSRRRRDVLAFLGGILILLAIVLLAGSMTPAPESASGSFDNPYIAMDGE